MTTNPTPPAGPTDSSAGRHLRLLAVEDSLVNRKLIFSQLTRLGFEVQVVENGVQAVEAWEKSEFDAIFMDCHMPVMDGWQATREIRAREERLGRRRVPIIALTATALQEDRQLCRDAGMDAWLAKPAAVAVLRSTLEQLLARNQGPSEGQAA